MAEQDIREDQMTITNTVDYLRGLNGKNSVLIKKDDLVRITPISSFNGDFKDPANFPKAGFYIYEVNTSSSGTFNGQKMRMKIRMACRATIRRKILLQSNLQEWFR